MDTSADGLEFDPEVWRDRLDRRGETIRWLMRMTCPCVDPATQRATKACPRCGGTKWLFVEKTVTGYRAHITEQAPQWAFTGTGQYQMGDIFCQTMPDEIPLSHLDVVILTTRYEEDTAVLKRGTNDRLNRWPCTELVAVTTVATAYVPDTDCELSADGRTITWLTTGPATGTQYTVRFRYEPTYDVLPQLPHRRKQVDGVRLPQAVGLRQRTVTPEEVWEPGVLPSEPEDIPVGG
jgi:hypothetical protein